MTSVTDKIIDDSLLLLGDEENDVEFFYDVLDLPLQFAFNVDIKNCVLEIGDAELAVGLVHHIGAVGPVAQFTKQPGMLVGLRFVISLL